MNTTDRATVSAPDEFDAHAIQWIEELLYRNWTISYDSDIGRFIVSPPGATFAGFTAERLVDAVSEGATWLEARRATQARRSAGGAA